MNIQLLYFDRAIQMLNIEYFPKKAKQYQFSL